MTRNITLLWIEVKLLKDNPATLVSRSVCANDNLHVTTIEVLKPQTFVNMRCIAHLVGPGTFCGSPADIQSASRAEHQ